MVKIFTWIFLQVTNRIGLILFIFFTTSIAHASKSSHIKQFPADAYLSSTYINHIIQRHDGFIWIATADGISRFDGNEVVNHLSYTENPHSLPNPWANYLYEDTNKQLWVGTAIGLARMLPDGISFEQYSFSPTKAHSISGNNIVHIFEDNNKRLWFASDRGLSMYQPSTNNFINHYISGDVNKPDLNNINAIAQKSEHQLWLANDNGLYVFDIHTAEFTHFSSTHDDLKNIEILDLAMDSKGSLWMVTAYTGLFKLSKDLNQITPFNHDPKKPNTIVSNGLWSIMIDRDDNVWVASWGEGISKISASDGSIQRYTHIRGDQQSIPSNLTTDIFQDVSGLLWIATYDGIALLDPNSTVNNIRPVPGKNDSLSSELVWDFEETDDAYWVGTTEGINRWDKLTGSFENYYSGSNEGNQSELAPVWTMAMGVENNIWIGSEFGLAQFNTVNKQLTYLSEKPEINRTQKQIDVLNKPVWTIKKNTDHSIWVGTNSANLYLVSKDLRLINDYSQLIQSTLAKYDNIEFTEIIQTDNQSLWLCTASGMFFFDLAQSKITPVRSSTGDVLFEKDWIYAVDKKAENQYWISSQNHGLSLFNFKQGGTLKRLMNYNYSHPNIVDNNIYNIVSTNNSDVWFTGKNNLYHLNLNDSKVINYGHRYFESDLNFHENSQFLTTNNTLLLGSNRGIIQFDPTLIRKSNFQPKVYITGIKSNSMRLINTLLDPKLKFLKQKISLVSGNRPIHLIKKHVFDYNDTLITFNFSALDYMHADDLNYAYRMAGFDNHWNELNNRNELAFSNLPAGNYHLEIKATNADLLWSDHTASLDFTVLPKPWLTWWAKLLYLLSFLFLALFIFRLYRARLITQYQLDHREVQLSQAIWGSGDELWEWNINKQQIIRTSNKDLDDNRRRFFNGSFESNDLDIHPDDITGLQQKIQDLLTGTNNEFDAVYRQKNHQGTWLWMQDRAKVTVWSENKKPLIINGISRNINAIKKKEEKSQLIATAFQSSSDGALVLDANLKVISINAAFTEITGYDDRIIDDSLNTHSGRIFTRKMDSNALYKHIKRDLRQDGAFRDEILIKTIYNTTLPIDLRVNCIYNTQKLLTHYIATLTDITYHKDTEKVLTKLANYDSLTGLPNRSLMMIQLDRALTQAQQNNKQMAIMFIDLDHFKNINDSLGHTIGDELLIAVAKRLSVCIKTSDTIARIGGDEFTIGILNYDSSTDVIKLAEDILNTMSKPFQLENHELIITPSIGIAIYNGGQIDTETLLMQADTAMYHAKKKGRNNFRFFTESMNQAVLKRVDIEMRLRKALENQEFSLNYQPKYSLKTGHVSGFEALLRWNDKHGNITPPDEFIPIAEETGLIFSIGEFVLQSACQELKNWHNCGHENVSIAINLSAIQFMDKKLVESVGQIIQKFKTPPMSLEIEITESTLIENLPYAIKTLQQLRKLGVKLSLDDFGTGFSSLNYLKQFPIHALKIDRSFILDMVSDTRDASMVASIISLAHNLSIDVIAEGVETQEQLNMLIAFEVEEVQGFLLSKPINSDKVVQILNKNQTVSSLLSH